MAINEEEVVETQLIHLPEDLTNKITSLLSVEDQILFAAVSRRFRSIHRNRRRLPAHPPPPAAPSGRLPWIITWPPLKPRHCYSPSTDKLHCLHLLPDDAYCTPLWRATARWIAASHGWLVLIKDLQDPSISLLNPISRHEFRLPSLHPHPEKQEDEVQVFADLSQRILKLETDGGVEGLYFRFSNGSEEKKEEEDEEKEEEGISWFPVLNRGVLAMSAPPTDPRFSMIITFDSTRFFIYQPSGEWVALRVGGHLHVETAVFYKDKFYFAGYNKDKDLLIIDPATSTSMFVPMRFSDDGAVVGFGSERTNFLVECDGELLCVSQIVDRRLHRYVVYTADISREMWVRKDTGGLGDRCLFLCQGCCFSLPAADVGFGGRGNLIFCTYFNLPHGGTPSYRFWEVVDLTTGAPPPTSASSSSGSEMIYMNKHWLVLTP